MQALIDAILERDEHRWFTGKESEETKRARAKAMEEFKQRYAK